MILRRVFVWVFDSLGFVHGINPKTLNFQFCVSSSDKEQDCLNSKKGAQNQRTKTTLGLSSDATSSKAIDHTDRESLSFSFTVSSSS